MLHFVRSAFAVCAFALPGAALAAPPSLQQAIGDPEDFKLSASVRVRYETLDGQSRPGLDPRDDQLALRATLAAEYHREGFRLGAELFDSRAYFTEPGSAASANEVNTLELVQAYVGADLGGVLGRGSKTEVQLGRFTLNLGSRRLVAADEYRNTTNGYTGARIDLKTADGSTATLIYTLPQLRRPDDLASVLDNRQQSDRESFDLRLWGAIAQRPKVFGETALELAYFRLHERDSPDRPTRNRDLHTLSARMIRNPKASAWDYEVEGIYQLGAVRSSIAPLAARLPVSAWFVHADAGYTFPGPAKLRLSVEYDQASGDGPGRGFGRFDTLFGMRRADLAPSGIYAAVGRANILTPGIRAEIAPSRRLDAFAGYRAMWLSDRHDAFSTTGVRDAAGASGRFAGHQVDARLRYWLIPAFLRAEMNAVWLAKGRFLKHAPNAPRTGDTHYLSTALVATF